MGRASGKRTWIKLYCWGRLHGSMIYQLSEEEQSIWDKLLCYAGILGREGQISDNDGRPFPHNFIAHELHTSEELLESTLQKCKEEGRITEDEQGIHIVNWAAYQSEYERQKPYRERKKEQLGQDEQDDLALFKKAWEERVGAIDENDEELLLELSQKYKLREFAVAVEDGQRAGHSELRYIAGILRKREGESR